jgi:hypothetical protein
MRVGPRSSLSGAIDERAGRPPFGPPPGDAIDDGRIVPSPFSLLLEGTADVLRR